LTYSVCVCDSKHRRYTVGVSLSATVLRRCSTCLSHAAQHPRQHTHTQVSLSLSQLAPLGGGVMRRPSRRRRLDPPRIGHASFDLKTGAKHAAGARPGLAWPTSALQHHTSPAWPLVSFVCGLAFLRLSFSLSRSDVGLDSCCFFLPLFIAYIISRDRE